MMISVMLMKIIITLRNNCLNENDDNDNSDNTNDN